VNPWPRLAGAEHHVYELYAADGECLYVGCTSGLDQRLATHAKARPWSMARLLEHSDEVSVADRSP
jgi:predicted GIY-YIG superfamily endonuclease